MLSVLDQKFDHDFGIIVVNDSGDALVEEEWQRSPKVQILATNRRNRSVARNVGAAVARDRYLHFLDDDDWMLPGAFQQFCEAATDGHAGYIHGAFRMVDNCGETVTELYPDEAGNSLMPLIAWEWLPLQAP